MLNKLIFVCLSISLLMVSSCSSVRIKNKAQENITDIDLYNTYYFMKLSSELNDSLGCSLDLNFYNENPNLFITHNNKFDNLSNIYYVLELMHDANVKPSYMLKEELSGYLNGLQTNIGNFAFSIKHKEEIESTHEIGHETYLSSYSALKSYAYLDITISKDQASKLNHWIDGVVSHSDFWDSLNIESVGDLLMVLEISKLAKIDLSKHGDDIHKSIFKLSDEIKDYLKKAKLSLFLLNDIERLLSIANVGKEKYFTPDTITFLLSLQTKDGGFKLFEANENSDLLSAYYGLRLLRQLEQDIPRREELIVALKKYGQKNACFDVSTS
ncbi:hypothetical protein [Paenibacillus sp. MMS18-CY102]|uniref:hypothetical protein n=1 Tax=Paenibacillus sp. MMS18-CY102 TaxID=2682849 RepID=UPI001366654A|nr:hypothetical protein [Paenibacillus sp. MMS18-CY102]MWC29735.1 hypothetical protein [Paenibacillus sp. MMS18-CY102]